LNFPNAVIIDPELTLNLPQEITADTAMDALAHAIEAYTSRKANIFSDMLAETAIKLIANNLRLAYTKGNKNMEARYNLSIAASLAMHSVVVASAGLAHYMNSSLGERTHISHGKACTLLLPHVMLFNLLACPSKFARIAELMGENISGLSIPDAAYKSVDALKRLIRDIDMPQILSDVSDIEINEAKIAAMAKEVHASKRAVLNKTNPRHVKQMDTIRIFAAAVHGQP
jgi:1,3-propanediol dehydrogenase